MRGLGLKIILLASALSAARADGAEVNLYLDLDFHTLETARNAVQRALETRETGDRESWAVTGIASGSVTPRRTWRSTSGHWCRTYRERMRLADGRATSWDGTRCRNAEGLWISANQ